MEHYKILSVKIRLLTLAIIVIIFNSCESKNGYLKIDKNYTNRKQLINNIIPSKGILYWKYVESFSNKVIREVGNVKLLETYKIIEPNKGFFIECMPGYCYSYIVYIDNKGLNYVTDEKTLVAYQSIDLFSEVPKTESTRSEFTLIET